MEMCVHIRYSIKIKIYYFGAYLLWYVLRLFRAILSHSILNAFQKEDPGNYQAWMKQSVVFETCSELSKNTAASPSAQECELQSALDLFVVHLVYLFQSVSFSPFDKNHRLRRLPMPPNKRFFYAENKGYISLTLQRQKDLKSLLFFWWWNFLNCIVLSVYCSSKWTGEDRFRLAGRVWLLV